jgi:hypothetical protein
VRGSENFYKWTGRFKFGQKRKYHFIKEDYNVQRRYLRKFLPSNKAVFKDDFDSVSVSVTAIDLTIWGKNGVQRNFY